MKKIFLFILLFGSLELSSQEKNNNQSFFPDLMISEISLMDSLNACGFLGIKSTNTSISKEIFKKTFSNKNNTQILEISSHPGSKKNEFSEFKVYYNHDVNFKNKLDVSEFITENNVCLGLTRSQLKSIKGKPSLTFKKDDILVLSYIINDFQNSPFLKKYNLPIYYSKYFFKSDLLVRFEFGFEYP